MSTSITNYFTAAGQIIGERTAGSLGHDYLPDGAYNVSAASSPNTQSQQLSARYYAYGQSYAVQTTGTTPTYR